MKIINQAELKQMLIEAHVNLMDIRRHADYEKSHIAHAIHFDVNQLEMSFARINLDPTQPLIVYCYHGVSSVQVAEYFASIGFKQVYSLQGGYSQWSSDI